MNGTHRYRVDLQWVARSVHPLRASALWLAVWSTTLAVFFHAGRAEEQPPAERQLRFRVLHTMEEWDGQSLELHTLTLQGHVRDQQGNPVAGANVCLASCNRTRPGNLDPLLARTTTEADGEFLFRDIELPVLRLRPDPIPKPPQGDFIVFGWHDGFGFTWRAKHSYRPERRPDGIAPGDPELETTRRAVYAGEPLDVDLVLEPSARLHGQLLDDQGQPLAQAKVQVGCCDNLRFGWGKSSYCLHRGSAEGHAVRDGTFDAIESLPADLRETRTDARGQFALNGLRRDTEYQVLIDPGPEFDPLHETIATLNSPSPNPTIRYLGYDGELNPVVDRPRELTVRVTRAENGQPATGVTVRAHGQKLQRSGTMHTTNAEGRATLHLSPGLHTLYFDPPANMDAIAHSTVITVAREPLAQSVDVKIEPGAVVVVQAVDADTGAPVEGVQFLFETDASRQQKPLHSQTVFADYPATNAHGELRAVVPPGQRRLVVGQHPADWQPIARESDLVDLEPERTKTVCFRFSKKTERMAAEGRMNPFGYPPELIEAWDRQQGLQVQAKCRLTGRRHRSSHALAFGRVAEVLNRLDPDTPPDLASVFREQLGDELPMVEARITVDGAKRRDESRQLERGSTRESVYVSVLNGQAAVSYRSPSAQADVHAVEKFNIHVDGLRDVCTWPFTVRTGRAGPSTAGDPPNPKITRQNGKVTIDAESESRVLHSLVSATNGFSYRRQMHSLQRISAHGEWQFAPRVYPNGMVLPACRVEVRSSGKTKCIVSAFVLETAEFYEQLPPDAFVVSVPAGVNALDWRQVPDTGLRRPEGGVVRGPVPDVVAYLNARSGHSPIKPVLTYGQPAPAVHPAKWLSQAGEIPPPETKDKVVLIDFWGIGCGPCVAQLPDVQAAARHFKDTDLVLIGLHESRAEIEQVRQFATDRHLEYVLAIDREPSERGWFGATMQAYGVQGIPAAAVIDRAGKLVYLGELRQALSRAANVLNQK